ncbi:hypothetical protein HBI82_224810 [Parastagonospora nodorum]|nr:hypothetical protein HBI23_207310 [Parastagonospora nodorum]KAH5983902.1 hypothetical protein HBI82_224810 [Parastagonospora nodorum]
MRLINTSNFRLEEFFDKYVPKYAILSHTWGQDEVILAEYEQRMGQEKWNNSADHAVSKIKQSCRQAAEDGYAYVWVDTCCIDKRGSAELTEAINSMYQWYKDAEICYVYINDVAKQRSWKDTDALLRKARWFTRGWTLQELLAPRHIKFYDSNWSLLGGRGFDERVERVGGSITTDRDGNVIKRQTFHIDKRGYSEGSELLFALVSEITKIELKVIEHEQSVERVLVAKRMSWAAHRVTTRKEDLAYCLLGLFDVNMALLYGEGYKAFQRLQVVIMEARHDHSLMAWDYGLQASYAQRYKMGCLAQLPSDFRDCHLLDYSYDNGAAAHYSMTNLGVHITLPVIDLPHMNGKAVLAALTVTDGRGRGSVTNPFTIAIALFQNLLPFTEPRMFHRAPYQTRPLLMETSAFRNARPQAMYLSGMREGGNSNVGGDRSPYTIGGTELVLTERYPYTYWDF